MIREEQRREDGRTVIVLHGAFDSSEALRVLDIVSSLPASERVRVDFHETRRVDDFAFASFAGEVAPDERARVELVGISRHLERLLRYLHPPRLREVVSHTARR